MTTEMTVRDEGAGAPRVPVIAGGKLAAFVPSNIDEAWRLAGALARSEMTPRAYGNNQNKIMVGILAGAEVGLTPFAALQSIAVIGNNPSLWGDGALALVQASGLVEDMEETDDGHTATCRMNRKGRTTPIVRTFSMDDAKKAGLAGKSGPWSQYPARMRQMRARAFALRDGFSDVLKGLHIAEEVRDYTPMGADTVDSPGLTVSAIEHQAAGTEPEPTESEPTGVALDEAVFPNTVTLESAKAEIDGCELVLDVNGRVAALLPLLGEEDADALRGHAMDRIAALNGS